MITIEGHAFDHQRRLLSDRMSLRRHTLKGGHFAATSWLRSGATAGAAGVWLCKRNGTTPIGVTDRLIR